jgi:hypothetical protein
MGNTIHTSLTKEEERDLLRQFILNWVEKNKIEKEPYSAASLLQRFTDAVRIQRIDPPEASEEQNDYRKLMEDFLFWRSIDRFPSCGG